MTDEQRNEEDRRARYSLPGHLRRLSRSGGLKQIALATVVAATIGGITFARCQSSSITGPSSATRGPASPNADLLGGGSGSVTQPENNTFRVPFSKTVTNECNGQLVNVSGEMHIEQYAHVMNDGGFHAHEMTTDNLKGESVDGTTQYTASDQHHEARRIDATSAYFTNYKYEKLIANGPQPDFFVRMKMTMKYNATDPLGSPPVPDIEIDADCHGQCRPGEKCLDPCPSTGCAPIVD